MGMKPIDRGVIARDRSDTLGERWLSVDFQGMLCSASTSLFVGFE